MEKYKPTIDWPLRDARDADALPDGSVTWGGANLSHFTKTGEGWKEAGWEVEPIASDQLVYPRAIISVPANTHITLAIDNTQALDVGEAARAIVYAGNYGGDHGYYNQSVLDRLNEAGYDIVKMAA